MALANGAWSGLGQAVRAFTGPWTRTNGAGWIALIVFILVLRWGFFELYSIPSGSMLPTLNGDPRFLRGDRVAVNKFIYGPRIPFTTNRIVPFWEPKRWDIVVFNNVEPDAEHPILIKRVVALPGERIHISGGRIYIDGEAVSPPPELEDVLYYTDSLSIESEMERSLFAWAKKGEIPASLDSNHPWIDRLKQDIADLHLALRNVDLRTFSDQERTELLKDMSPISLQIFSEWAGRQSRRLARPVYGVLEDDAHSVVPEGHYLMLGDNSANSLDGRFFGWVPHSNLYGRAFAVAWPFANMKDLTGFTRTFSGLFFLIGIPGLLILWEVSRSFFWFTWRVRDGCPSLGLAPGDRVLISRVAFGLRLPFMKRASLFLRPPKPGEAVAYICEGKDQELGLFFGTIESLNGAPASAERYFVQSEPGSHRGPLEVGADELVGRVASVWWPLGKRRRVSSNA